MARPRYIVGSISGYSATRSSQASTSYYVLDTHVAHREVTTALSGAGNRAYTDAHRRRMMEDVAARLNAEHDAWARENGYPA